MSVRSAHSYSPIVPYTPSSPSLGEDPPIPIHIRVQLFWRRFEALKWEGTYQDFINLALQSKELESELDLDSMLQGMLKEARTDPIFQRLGIYADMSIIINGVTPFASLVKAFSLLKSGQYGSARDVLASHFKNENLEKMVEYFIERYRYESPLLAYYFGCLKWFIGENFNPACLNLEMILHPSYLIPTNWPPYLKVLSREMKRELEKEALNPSINSMVVRQRMSLDDSADEEYENRLPTTPTDPSLSDEGFEEEPPSLGEPQDDLPEEEIRIQTPTSPSNTNSGEEIERMGFESPHYPNSEEESVPDPESAKMEFQNKLKELLRSAKTEKELLQLAFAYRRRLQGTGFNLNENLEKLLTDARSCVDYRLTRTIANMDRIINGNSNQFPWVVEAFCLLKEGSENSLQALTLLRSIFSLDPSLQIELFKKHYAAFNPTLWRCFDTVQQFYDRHQNPRLKSFNFAVLKV